MPQYWLKFLGAAARVKRYVGLTSLDAGSNLAGAATLRDLFEPYSERFLSLFSALCGSCTEFNASSPMVKLLGSGRGVAAVPGITYTTIPTKHDELVVPTRAASSTRRLSTTRCSKTCAQRPVAARAAAVRPGRGPAGSERARSGARHAGQVRATAATSLDG